MILCTLFDSNYLDKGIVLYESLAKMTSKFHLYIFAFDDKCEVILKDLNYNNMTVISYEELEEKYPILRKIKEERTRAEFCWTCSSLIIEFILEEFHEKSCTYIDADMYFFGNPNTLYKEILNSKDLVGIAPHRFRKDHNYNRNICTWGKYCVHFNTFFNCKKSLYVLKEWKNNCLESCSSKPRNGSFGDQLYLNEWTKKYRKIHVLKHLGGGAAPWNIGNYKISIDKNKRVFLEENGIKYPLIFYHFEGLKYLQDNSIYMNIWEYNNDSITSYKIIDLNRYRIRNFIYKPYIKHIKKTREFLKETYGIGFEHLVLNKKQSRKYQVKFKNNKVLYLLKKRNIINY